MIEGGPLNIVLATDSREPSGMGEHMLMLGRSLATSHSITLAVFADGPCAHLLTRAARFGMAIKVIDSMEDFAEWLGRSGADLLHIHAGIGWEGHELAEAGHMHGLPVVRTEHLPYVLTDGDQIDHHREQVEGVEHLIVVSQASFETYMAQGFSADKITAIRNGIYQPEPTKSRHAMRAEMGLTDEKVLLTVARFTPQKDHITLIRALPIIIEAHPSAILLLAGTGYERDAVEAEVHRLGMDAHVRFLGHRTDIADLISIADLFVLPSLFEGLPLALLEAMSASLPVVATRIGGNTEALGDDHPFLVETGQPDVLADMVIALLGNPTLATQDAEAGLTRFQRHFHASRMGAETEGVYRHVLQSRPADTEGHTRMDKTRIGFIGVGGIAGRHLDILAQFDDVDLVAFADPDFGRAEHAAGRFGARAYDNHKSMLEDQKLDAVYVCIPPFAHGAVEEDLIAAKIPFFVEKPLSLDIELAERLAADIERENLITGVGYHWRYLDTVDEARHILSENPAQLISGYWLDQTPPPQWWWKNDKSGGQMVEQTTHILDLARYLVGDVTQVYGLASHKERGDFPELDVPTASTASLSFASGAVGNIGSTCILRWGHRVGLHIFADGLAMELTDHDIMVDVGAGRPTRHAEGDPVWREDRDFVDAVRGGENRIRCPYGEALKTHRLALAINDSARSGQPVKIAN